VGALEPFDPRLRAMPCMRGIDFPLHHDHPSSEKPAGSQAPLTSAVLAKGFTSRASWCAVHVQYITEVVAHGFAFALMPVFSTSLPHISFSSHIFRTPSAAVLQEDDCAPAFLKESVEAKGTDRCSLVRFPLRLLRVFQQHLTDSSSRLVRETERTE
jgi:hypothetical protein